MTKRQIIKIINANLLMTLEVDINDLVDKKVKRVTKYIKLWYNNLHISEYLNIEGLQNWEMIIFYKE